MTIKNFAEIIDDKVPIYIEDFDSGGHSDYIEFVEDDCYNYLQDEIHHIRIIDGNFYVYLKKYWD